VYDDVTYVYDDVTYVYDDVTYTRMSKQRERAREQARGTEMYLDGLIDK